MPDKVSETANIGRVLTFPSAGGAKPIADRRYAAVGWVGGVYPSAPLPARTAAFDGHCAFTRAARSAGLRFAVRSLSGASDRENNKGRRPGWHLIHREAVPLPRKESEELGVRSEELRRLIFEDSPQISGAAIDY